MAKATTISKMQQLLEKSDVTPKVFSKGEKIEGKIVRILKDLALVDLGAKAEGIIPLKELQEQKIQAKEGEKITATIAQSEGDTGTIVLTVRKGQKEQIWDELQQIMDDEEKISVKGLDTNRGGLIVDFNGVRGFIPSQHLVSNLRDSIGKKLSTKILEVNKNLNRLVLSEREVVGESLPAVELPFKVGDVLEVEITKILPFGLLVSIDGSNEGLIHISEISWNRVENISEDYKVKDKLKAKVISIDPATGRVNLSIKKLDKDPWEEAAKKYKVGSEFEKQVSRTANYGIFVQLEDGIEGLLHSSKIPYGMKLKEGDKIKISIDLFDSSQRRVALRLAQSDITENDGNKKKRAKKEKKNGQESD